MLISIVRDYENQFVLDYLRLQSGTNLLIYYLLFKVSIISINSYGS